MVPILDVFTVIKTMYHIHHPIDDLPDLMSFEYIYQKQHPDIPFMSCQGKLECYFLNKILIADSELVDSMFKTCDKRSHAFLIS